ncbi:E3 ubiquitin- ligase RMA1H1-like [Olea europaea subsp. europaea]|uniref:E3 ubiquitin- ligase RMA1H1-like n=1 Tax=Olea europaea subsp. europaea TaxID=158383 RepID=A0A8S0TYR3_OLEEU|nr:E3 ubiquitin- ligase RMA1H1-like [Olea europaea subsp. europaea]
MAAETRPPSPRCGGNVLIPTTTLGDLHPVGQIHHQSYEQQSRPYQPHSHNYTASPMLPNGGMATNLIDPMIGMFGEMVYSRIFGNSETTSYTHPNSYRLQDSLFSRSFEMIVGILQMVVVIFRSVDAFLICGSLVVV